MRYILSVLLSVSAILAQAQQVNPVTDYTFSNKMSVGRNTVTDTTAYFSVGPRFNAIRGMMPPMVNDTANISGSKRNGLLIFSMQKNKFQVWDSAGSKWADLTGVSGTAITSADTAAMLLPYLRKDDTTTMLSPYLKESDTVWLSNRINLKVNISDTAAMLLPYLQDADTTSMLSAYLRTADTTAMLSPYLKESDTVFLSNRINLKVNIADTSTMLSPYLLGSGTANYIPKFDATRSVINSKVYESGTNLMFNTTTPSFITSGISTIENNATTSAVYTYKIADTVRAYMGYGGANTFDINNLATGDIRFYTSATLRGRFQTDGTFRLNSLTGTGSRAVVADANGVLSASSSPTDLIDTTYMSTRAWRQKGDDSLGAIIATKGSGTVTSVATGYGLSGGTITTTGTLIVDSALVASRLRVGKVVDSLALVKQNVLTNPVTGTGTTNYVPKWTSSSAIGNSIMYDNGTNIGIGTTSPVGLLSLLQTGDTYTDGIAIQRTGLNRGTIFLESPTNTFNITRGKDAGNGLLINGQDEVVIGTTTDNGAYRFQIVDNTNSIYTSSGGVLAAISGNIGVGTSQLSIGSGKLRVLQNIRVVDSTTETNALLTSVTSTLSLIETRYPTPLAFGISASERARFNANGEFLLNTTTDAGDYKLQVSGNAYVTGTTILAATSGNVGVGTASPGTKLDVVGAIKSQATLYPQYILTETTANTTALMFYDGGASTKALRFRVSDATDRLSIDANGEVYINTLTDAGDYKLQVSGNVYSTGTYTSAAPTDGTAAPWRLGSYVTTAPTATGYVQVEINGVKYKLLAATY